MAQLNTLKKSIRRQVVERVYWRSLIVLLAVGAFFALSLLESLKGNYQKDSQAPLVIGQFASAMSNSNGVVAQSTSLTPSPNGAVAQSGSPTPIAKDTRDHVIPLDHDVLTTQLSSLLFPGTGRKEVVDLARIEEELAPIKTASGEKQYSKSLIEQLKWSAKGMRDRVLDSIARLSTVKDESALITLLTENIDEANITEQKKYADAQKSRAAAYKSLLVQYAGDPKFRKLESKEQQQKFVADVVAEINNGDQKEELRSKLDKSIHDDSPITLERLATIASEEGDLGAIDKALNGFAHVNYGLLYSAAATQELFQYIDKRRRESLSQNYFSKLILDEKRGEYALYQAIYITCVVILVFGLLYPFYLLLRLLPPFAASLDPLTDQAKGIISGRRDFKEIGASLAAPAIARTIALSVAAVGIGTAVAVANSGSSPQPQAAGTQSPIERDILLDPKIRRWIDDGRFDGPGPTTTATPSDSRMAILEHRLDLLVQEIGEFNSPQPSDPTLAMELGRLGGRFNDLRMSNSQLNSQIAGLAGRTLDIENRTQGLTSTDLSSLHTDFPVIKSDTQQLKRDVPDISGKLANLQDRADYLETDLFAKLDESATRLDTANNQILGARFNDTGNPSRSFFGKLNLFATNKYLVTYQSYRIMENLMCEQPVGFSRDPDAKTCTIEANRQLLANIRKYMKEQPAQLPVNEATLLDKVSAKTSPWKNQLLRYTRLPN